MTDVQNDCGTDNSKPDPPARQLSASRAAYLLGRNLPLMEAWLSAVDSIAQEEDRPWEWEPHMERLSPSYDLWPMGANNEIDDALRALVQSRVVDAAALVEFRVLLDRIAQALMAIAELARDDRREEVLEMSCGVWSKFFMAEEFAAQLFINGAEPLNTLRKLGGEVGQLFALLFRIGDHETYLPILHSAIAHATILFPHVVAARLARVRDLVPSYGQLFSLRELGLINQQLTYSLGEFDNWIVERLRPDASLEPSIILDDRREMLSFLSADIPFEEFRRANALGGLRIFRILVRHVGQDVSVAELIRIGELHVEEEQVAVYLSRFRAVLRTAMKQWQISQASAMHPRALMGFVVASRPQRRSKPGQLTGYRLDLPRNRVRYVAAH